MGIHVKYKELREKVVAMSGKAMFIAEVTYVTKKLISTLTASAYLSTDLLDFTVLNMFRLLYNSCYLTKLEI